MNHPPEDQLLLLAYDELPAAAAAELEAHLATCAVCRDDLARLERARVALDWAPQPRRRARWIVAGLAAAAAMAAILLTGRPPVGEPPSGWPGQRPWSATAGYIAGGQPLIAIDAELTRLEQERSYVRP
jgi:putative zinc finger protein